MVDGFDVQGSELHDGSSRVRGAVGGAQDHGLGDAAGTDAQYGHSLLHQAVAGFCAAMNTAVEAMVAQARQTGDGLDASASTYSNDDASARDEVVGAGG